ncbi:hypothetical protein [Hyphococcus lacteus]|uniref:Uncharacterized protein n=1 Tax=Hyphococcus lacteus TaxID=3143536 RepID=A0ABV3Z4A2_9PROT
MTGRCRGARKWMLAGFRYFPEDRRSLSLRLGLMPDKVWLGISGVEYGRTAYLAI